MTMMMMIKKRRNHLLQVALQPPLQQLLHRVLQRKKVTRGVQEAFYDSHALRVRLQEAIWRENHKNCPCTVGCHFHGKAWPRACQKPDFAAQIASQGQCTFDWFDREYFLASRLTSVC